MFIIEIVHVIIGSEMYSFQVFKVSALIALSPYSKYSTCPPLSEYSPQAPVSLPTEANLKILARYVLPQNLQKSDFGEFPNHPRGTPTEQPQLVGEVSTKCCG
jgi:hypothetical protein